MLVRKKYLDRIRPYYDSDLIKVLTGVRRCGKSTIMQQIIAELSESVPKDRILYIDLESYDYLFYQKNPQDFYSYVKDYVNGKSNVYVFIDEVQFLDDFERVIASIRSSLGCSVFVTGSTSNLLSGNLAARLTGRVIEFLILPFSYSEVVEYTGRSGDDALNDYILYGGMPKRFNEPDKDKNRNLYALYEAILQRDIIGANSISNIIQFKNIASYSITNSGQVISAKNVSGYLEAKDMHVAQSTVYQYVDYLEKAFLLLNCKRFDLKGKQILDTLSKHYAIDPSFITIQKGNHQDINKGFLLETIVYLELISRGYEVFVGKTYKGEVDFVVNNNSKVLYIQVAYLLATEEVSNREFSAFSSIKDNYPKYVISLDKIDLPRDGIIHLNIERFLLDQDALRF